MTKKQKAIKEQALRDIYTIAANPRNDRLPLVQAHMDGVLEMVLSITGFEDVVKAWREMKEKAGYNYVRATM